jgi:molybdate transport system substrate-binding protein
MVKVELMGKTSREGRGEQKSPEKNPALSAVKKAFSSRLMARQLPVLLLLLGLIGCGARQSGGDAGKPRTITVFAAASLADAFNELAETFTTQHQGAQVIFNYGGSSQLAAQLNGGIVADVFASANLVQMQNLIDGGRIEASAVETFASNRLTIIVPADNPAGIHALEELGRPGVRLILALEGVPVRQYTDEIVATFLPDFQAGFYGNLVSAEENVRRVAAKVALGEADAGIVYASDVTPDIAARVQQIAIPDGQNALATYPIAVLADAPDPELAQRFVDFVFSSEGQRILARWGFGPPPER